MKKFLKSKDMLLLVSFGNFILWMTISFLIVGGCAFGQEPYKLSKIGPLGSGLTAHPVLWWYNYLHTATLAISVPLMFIYIRRAFSAKKRNEE